MKIKLDKKDYLRSILTDTSPSDVPSIFSNEGFYINSKIYDLCDDEVESYSYIKEIFEEYINDKGRVSALVPFKYKIYKDGKSLRGLSLLHPSSQFQIANLYKEYSPILNNLCTKSKFSIRAPVKVSNSFCIKSDARSVSNDYKIFDVDTIDSELYKRTASSYFAYKGVTRLYKLYNSSRYIDLEKKYSNMWMLDISNCFNSIYTHSIGWAINNKEYSKFYASKRVFHISEKIDS
ncbi:hypothetical protein SAMN02745127_02988 [Oceanospirillum multiglobuliferum]|uniref:Reverse transcriptase domain-containing protein n=1 Tax=Oceanospirillum multiglobuliferum TaxID=64969 RepID=A0A1T4SE83_9GAMM|nr:hypothetical protein [Oceanospirillum multiglobuliferum]OPX54309.1 hypothetical protein BTE48_14695 [Oceanospirillum multiglobuliferum]SKA26446.1 hypothetical protein SAMN02745127_02988 [Oceanospirillum multiglobuliferum]